MKSSRPKWIQVGTPAKDLFDIIELLKHGESIAEIAKSDRSITVKDIQNLLKETSEYLKNHLILDTYLEDLSKINSCKNSEEKKLWTEIEIRELVNLHVSGASIENISHLIRKSEDEVRNKLQSLNLTIKGK